MGDVRTDQRKQHKDGVPASTGSHNRTGMCCSVMLLELGEGGKGGRVEGKQGVDHPSP